MKTIWCLVLTATAAFAARPYRGGAIAAAHPTASAAGLQMFERGGNAADAVAAAAFVMAVVGPYHSGLGGGGFAVVWDAKAQHATARDFREVAPARATREMFMRDGQAVPALSTDGALSVAVPGAVMGYLELAEKHGRLKRAQLLAPAIKVAREGFVVTPKYVDMAQDRADCLSKDPEARRLFLHTQVGQLLKQPELARTLEAISRDGAKAFYTGPVARAVAQSVAAAGGVLTAADLAAYQTRTAAPLEGSYRGHRVVTMPPPSAGGLAVLQVLGVLERFSDQGLSSRAVPVLHTYVEALRRVYADRAKYLGDPRFTTIPLERLSSGGYFEQLLTSIDPKKATASTAIKVTVEQPPADMGKHTTHLSAIDAEGNAVALTTTINYAFGSCLVAKGTGVLLNDEMDDFAAQPGAPNVYGLVTGEANAVAAGKVPLSSMSPTLVFQQGRPTEVMLAVGSPGGSTIPTTVMQVVSNVVDGHLDVVRAVGFGRVHHQWLPDEVWVEPLALEPATAAALTAMGHTFKTIARIGDAEAVLVDPVTGLKTASSDPRNEGAPAGQD